MFRFLSRLCGQPPPNVEATGSSRSSPRGRCNALAANTVIDLGKPAPAPCAAAAPLSKQKSGSEADECQRPKTECSVTVDSLPAIVAPLLEGLAFSTQVLGAGSYGLVIKASLYGEEVAVKVMVTGSADDRAVAREVAVGPLPALTHPHIVKTFATRSCSLTDALFNALEAHRAEAQGRGPAQGGPMAPPKGRGRQAAGPHHRRLLSFVPAACSPSALPASLAVPSRAALVAPLESGSPLGALHEALARLGARVGGVVTLVVMELCCKGTLARAVHRGIFATDSVQWPPRVARRALVRTAAEVARALLHLHAGGIVHGDLKPGNVVLKASRTDRRGFTAKVCDFGLCHLLPDGVKSIDTCTWGTLSYMAPEAMMGHVGKPADVWSFGVILNELLTRQLPYGGETEQAILAFGIMQGTLQLQWPEVPARPEGGPAAGDGSCENPLVYYRSLANARRAPESGLSLGLGPASGVPDRCNTSGLDASCATEGASMFTRTPTTITSITATTNDFHASALASTATSAQPCTDGSGMTAVGGWDDLDPVLPCLVNLGRRCTARDPAARPCFAVVLGELVDMEIILKAARPQYAAKLVPSRPTSALPSDPTRAGGTSSGPAAGEAPAAPPAAAAGGEVQDILDATEAARLQLGALVVEARLRRRAAEAVPVPCARLPPDPYGGREPEPLPPRIAALIENARAAFQQPRPRSCTGNEEAGAGVGSGAVVSGRDPQQRREHAAAVEALRLAIKEQLDAALGPVWPPKQHSTKLPPAEPCPGGDGTTGPLVPDAPAESAVEPAQPERLGN